jgi:hypothetical protein
MKRIGEIAARLVANPVELVAAANQKRSTELKSGGRSAGRGSDQPPTLCVDAPTPSGSSEVDGKHGDAARPVGSTKPNVLSGQFQPSPARGRPVVVVVNTDMRRVNRRPTGFPSPALRRSLLIVIEGGRHASTNGF